MSSKDNCIHIKGFGNELLVGFINNEESRLIIDGGIRELDNDLMSMSGNMGNNLGTGLNAFDFNPSTDCCYQAYDDGEYDTGVINIGNHDNYVNYAEKQRKKWDIEL